MSDQARGKSASIHVEERLEVFGCTPDALRLLEHIWTEVEPRLDWVMEVVEPRLLKAIAAGQVSAGCDVAATVSAFHECMIVHLGRPIDSNWMRVAASVGNWITENDAQPYVVIAMMQDCFARAATIASENAADSADRASRLAILGAVNHMACELAVARVTRISMHREADRREKIAEQFRSTIAELVSETTKRSSAISLMAGRAKDSTRQLVVDAAEIASAAEQSAQVMNNAAKESATLVHSIDTTRQSVSEISRVSTDAAREADSASAVIAALSQHTSEIETVVKMIRDLADLTRMLALNATIEAAHAGDAGRGFAVVAEEVKALARQTEKATDEIVRQVAGIQSSGSRTVDANIAIAQSIGQVSSSTANFEITMEDQSGQVTTIASMIDETAMTARAMADTVSSIRSSAEQVDSQANNVEDAFSSVNEQLLKLDAAVNDFLKDIAA